MARQTNVKKSDPTYPRVYLVRGDAKLVAVALGSIMAGVAVKLLVFNTGILQGIIVPGGIFGSSLSALLAAWFFYSMSQRVILHENAIEKVTWFSRRKLSREEILGWRGESHRSYTYILVPREKHARDMRLPALFRWDKPFFEWKKSIPHLKN